MVLARIDSVKVYPQQARRNRLEGETRIVFTVLPGGVVDDIGVANSSGHPVLDDAAINAVRTAAPYMPYPENRPGGIRIGMTIAFYLDP